MVLRILAGFVYGPILLFAVCLVPASVAMFPYALATGYTTVDFVPAHDCVVVGRDDSQSHCDSPNSLTQACNTRYKYDLQYSYYGPDDTVHSHVGKTVTQTTDNFFHGTEFDTCYYDPDDLSRTAFTNKPRPMTLFMLIFSPVYLTLVCVGFCSYRAIRRQGSACCCVRILKRAREKFARLVSPTLASVQEVCEKDRNSTRNELKLKD